MNKKNPKITRWDLAEYLKAEQDITVFFEVSLEIVEVYRVVIEKFLGAIARAHRLWSISVL